MTTIDTQAKPVITSPADLELFRSAGEALYGPFAWKGTLAMDMEVDERTVQRWAKGEKHIPEGVWAAIAQLCSKRANETLKMGRKLRARAAGE